MAKAEVKKTSSKGLTADEMGLQQREISVSEFFLKNRHLLGFDNPKKALLTTIKEAVDNSLDACEEAKILPEILIEVKQLQEDRFIVVIAGHSSDKYFFGTFSMGGDLNPREERQNLRQGSCALIFDLFFGNHRNVRRGLRRFFRHFGCGHDRWNLQKK